MRGVVRGGWVPSFGEAFAAALALRAAAFLLPASCSDDLPRYVWEGLLQHEGHNPYLVTPRNPLAAGLAAREPELFAVVNNKGVPAAYPPAVQLVFFAVTALTTSALAMKAVFAAFDLLVFCVLWRMLPAFGLSPCLALIHGLAPLAILEFAAEGHNDSLGILGLVLALALLQSGRPWWAGSALGLGITAKLLPVVALPFMARKDWRVLPGCLVAAALLCLPYAAPTTHVFEGLLEYGARWRDNDGLYGLVHWATAVVQGWLKGLGVPYAEGRGLWSFLAHGETQRVAKIPIAVLYASLAWFLWRRRVAPAAASATLVLAALLLSPTVHPWYVAWMVPLLCLYRIPAAMALTLLVPLGYAPLPGWVDERRWEMPLVFRVLEYAPVFVLLAACRWAPRSPPDATEGRESRVGPDLSGRAPAVPAGTGIDQERGATEG